MAVNLSFQCHTTVLIVREIDSSMESLIWNSNQVQMIWIWRPLYYTPFQFSMSTPSAPSRTSTIIAYIKYRIIQ